MKEKFELSTEYIELIKLLKVMKLVATGGEAKQLVEDGLVFCNNEPESRKRYKVKKGDVITLQDITIEVV